jgi:transposase InsO family protein
VAQVIGFMEGHHEQFGVEPMCRALQIAPSTWHAHAAAKANPELRSKRAKDDDVWKDRIRAVFDANFGVYGVRKVWRQMKRENYDIARSTVARLMRAMGLKGVIRGKPVKTTIQDKKQPCPLDKVNRTFKASRPNQLWVSDFTYVRTQQGFTYVAFVIDVFARRIVGWKASTVASAQFVLDALEQALWDRKPGGKAGLIHHSDRGSQYLSMRYTERLAEADIVPSVGSVGDSYDNAMAESINGLFKAEVIHRRRSWKSCEQVELATLKWVTWFNTARLFEPIGNIPPAEAEANHYLTLEAQPLAA